MSSTYQWIAEDTDVTGLTTCIVIDLHEDADDEGPGPSGGCRWPGPHSHEDVSLSTPQQQQQVLLEQLRGSDAHSEGRASRRSHRTANSKRTGSGKGTRQSVSGSGSHHSSRSGATGGGRGHSRRPAWMTAVSVYGAEPLEDSDEELEPSSSPPPTSKRGGGGGATADMSRPRARVYSSTVASAIAPSPPSLPDSADEADGEVDWGVRGREAAPRLVPPVDSGSRSPVTATFYFTPNTNAEARASAEEAMRNGGLLYPVSGPRGLWGAAPSGSSAGGRTGALTQQPTELSPLAPPPPRHGQALAQAGQQPRNKKLRKKVRGRAGGSAADSDGVPDGTDTDDASFAATVEALARRAQRERWHMQDYDSDHEERLRQGQPHPPPHREESESEEVVSPVRWGGGRLRAVGPGLASSTEPTPRARARSVSSDENDFSRHLRQAAAHRERPRRGHGAVASFPAPQAPSDAQAIMEASGFFISPIHQWVAQETSPWAGSSGGPGAAGSSPFLFLGQGGLPTPPVSAGRRTISSGRSFLRLPADLELPASSTGGGGRHHRRESISSSSRRTGGSLAEASVPLSAHEIAKAAEEALLDNLTVVLANGSRRRNPGRSGGLKRSHESDESLSSFSSRTSTTSSSTCSSRPGRRIEGVDAVLARGGGRSRLETLDGAAREERRVLKQLRRHRNRRRRLERREAGIRVCGGSLPLGPCPSPSLAPPLSLLPSSRADTREDLLESFFMDAVLPDNDARLC